MSVMNASIGLTGAALAAAALAIPQSRNAWLPLWAAFGFLGSAAAWMVAASVSAWGLRAAELAALALQPSKLIAAQLHKQPLPTTLMAIAWTLDDASQANGKSARRVSRCLAMSLGCMLAALPIGAVACLLAYYWPHTGWIIPPAIVLSGGLFFQRLMTRRP